MYGFNSGLNSSPTGVKPRFRDIGGKSLLCGLSLYNILSLQNLDFSHIRENDTTDCGKFKFRAFIVANLPRW